MIEKEYIGVSPFFLTYVSMKEGIDWIHVPLPFSLSHVLYPGSDSHRICWIPAGGTVLYVLPS